MPEESSGKKKLPINKRYIIITIAVLAIIISSSIIIKDRYDYYKHNVLRKEASKLYEESLANKPKESEILDTTPEPTSAPSATASEEQSEQSKSTPVPTPTSRPIKEEFAALRKKFNNDDIVGWVRINGTTVDYPVVQAEDNDYYLKRDINGNTIKSGSIYMDFENDVSKEDKNTILYGHNMKENIMFHDIRYYKNKSYFDEHKYIIFNTIYGDAVWEIFSFYETKTTFYYIQVIFKTNDEFYELAKEMKARSMYDTSVEISESDRILTLSTCTNEDEDSRYVLNAKLITDISALPEALREDLQLE